VLFRSYIVMWDGSSLSSLGTGAAAAVKTLAIDPSTGYLYAGGIFATIGGVANTAYIAYWNGSTWNPLSTGLLGFVQSIAFSPNGDLYIGGNFVNADGLDGDYICYWDGTAFNRIGTTELSAAVRWVTFDNNGKLIATGDFINAGGNADADYIARWNGNKWEAFGTGLDNYASSLYVDSNNDVYVGGVFTTAGDLTLTDRIAVWKNGAWRMLDIDLPGLPSINSMFVNRAGSLYISGSFTGTAKTGKIAVNTVGEAASANSYCFIQIHGPGVLQSIVNYTTGKSIQFNGLTLFAGEWINMVLDPQQIAMTSSWRGNCLRYIIPGSDHGDFYLAPGENNISVFMPSGTDANSGGFMTWSPRYWSIEGARHD